MPVDIFFSCCDWEAVRENEGEANSSDENFGDSGEKMTNYNIQNGF